MGSMEAGAGSRYLTDDIFIHTQDIQIENTLKGEVIRLQNSGLVIYFSRKAPPPKSSVAIPKGTTNWVLSMQMHEPVESISHPNHHNILSFRHGHC